MTSARIAPIKTGSTSRKRRWCYGVAEIGERDKKTTDGGCRQEWVKGHGLIML